MNWSHRRRAWAFLSFAAIILFGAQPTFAQTLQELVAIHVEALGGQERIDALKAMRATGRVVAGGKRMQFTLIAARPNKIRLETEQGGRSLVQATDGQGAPWEYDTGVWPPKYRDLAPAAARVFTADGEFDDPLVGGAARGFTLEMAAPVESEGKKLYRILATRKLADSYYLLLDPDTYLIVARTEQHKTAFGTTSEIITYFRDYRPVEGVLVPHKIVMAVDGVLKQQTEIDKIVPNPSVGADTFSRPMATVPVKP